MDPTTPLDLVIKNVRLVRPRRPEVGTVDLGVKDGRFARIASEIPTAGTEVYDARGRLTAQVTATFLRGRLAWDSGRVVGGARGRYIRRPA